MTEEYRLEPHHIFGLRQEVRNNVHFLDDQTIVFPSGNHCVRHHILQRWNKFILAADGSNGIHALAISPDRRYLAVSERKTWGTITIYDLQNQECCKRQVLTGGLITVQDFVCMAFSSDSKYLVGQTREPEWTLFYWDWENNHMIAMKKTTRIDLVTQVSFNPTDNKQICVTGKGVFEIFEREKTSLNQTTLFEMDEENILCHAWLSEDCIVAGTDTGKLLLLMVKSGDIHSLGMPCDGQTEERDSDVSTSSPTELPRVTAITQYSTGFACSAGPNLICLYEKTKDSYRKTGEIRIPQDPLRQSSQDERQEITSMCLSPSEETLAITTDQGQIYYIDLILSDISMTKQANFEFLFHSFHSGSITGLSVCLSKSLIATCSKDNSVRVWNYKTNSLELYKEFPKEPHCVSLHPNGFSILVGFTSKLSLMNLLVDTFRTVKEFFIGTCNVCAFNHDGNMFAAVNRTLIHICNIRTRKQLTLNGHLRKVLSVKWSEDDSRLVSCGADGAVYVWDVLNCTHEAHNIQRACVYTDVTFSSITGTVLAVGSDFKLKEIRDNRIIRELVSDDVAYTTIAMTFTGKMVFVGTSAGTVRAMEYPFRKEKRWTEYQAHSGPITKMVIAPGDRYLLTASEDGSLLIWTITDHLGCNLYMGKEIDYTEEVLCAKTYLEKKDEILQEANNQITWLKIEQEGKLTQKEMNCNKKTDDLMQNYLQQTEDLKGQNQVLSTENEGLKVFHQKTVDDMTKKHAKDLEDEKRGHIETLTVEFERHYEMQQRMKAMQKDYEEKLRQQEESHLHALEEMKQSCEAKLKKQQAKFEQEKKLEMIRRTRRRDFVELDHDELCLKYGKDVQELQNIKREFHFDIDLLAKQLLQLRNLKKDLEERDQSIQKLKEDLKNTQDQHNNAVNKIKELTKEKEEQKKTNCIQKTQIAALLKKLERFNKGYEYDCVILQKQLRQARQERDDLKKIVQQKDTKQMLKKIEDNKTVIKELETEVAMNNRKNKEIIEDLKKRLRENDQELCSERNKARQEKTLVERMKADIQKGSNFLQHPKLMNDYFIKLQKCYVQNTDASTMMAEELSQDRTENYKMQMILNKKNAPTFGRAVSSEESLKKSLQGSVRTIKLHSTESQRLRTDIVDKGQRLTSSGALHLPPIKKN